MFSCASGLLAGRLVNCLVDATLSGNAPGELTKPLPLRVVAPRTPTVLRFARTSTAAAAAAGLPALEWTLVDQEATQAAVFGNATETGSYHAFLVPSHWVGEAAASGGLQDLSVLVARDQTLNWSTYLPLYKELGAVHADQVVGVPTHGSVAVLYYRRDVFSSAGLPPPRTWAEAVAAAARFNGTDLDGDGSRDDDWGICLWQPVGCPTFAAPLSAILASLVQTRGRHSRLYFDISNSTDTMRSVIDTVAWDAALTLLRALSEFAPPPARGMQAGEAECWYQPRFTAGRCAMAVSIAGQFKRDSSSIASAGASAGGDGTTGGSGMRSVRGRVGVAMLPGSVEVLDWKTNRMVSCDTNRCPTSIAHDSEVLPYGGPYVAVQRPAATASAVQRTLVMLGPQARALLSEGAGTGFQRVNHAPFAGACGYTLLLNGSKSEAERLAMFLAGSQAVNPTRSWELAASPETFHGPTRAQHVDLGVLTAATWMSYGGYDEADLNEFLNATRASLSSPNVAIDLQSAGALNWTRVLLTAAAQVADPAVPLPQVAVATRELFDTLFPPAVLAMLRPSYIASITNFTGGRQWSPLPPPPPPGMGVGTSPTTPVTDGGVAPRTSGGSDDNTYTAKSVALGAALGGGLLALLLVGYVLWRKGRRAGRRGTPSGIQAPGVGMGTSLVVTDIQDSTRLWETLPAAVMDASVQLHHVCIRRCATSCGGYESATEGDSFILAFHSAQAAMLFCLAAQEELPGMDWPEALLQIDICRPVWVTDTAVAASGIYVPGLPGPAWAHPAAPSEAGVGTVDAGGTADGAASVAADTASVVDFRTSAPATLEAGVLAAVAAAVGTGPGAAAVATDRSSHGALSVGGGLSGGMQAERGGSQGPSSHCATPSGPVSDPQAPGLPRHLQTLAGPKAALGVSSAERLSAPPSLPTPVPAAEAAARSKNEADASQAAASEAANHASRARAALGRAEGASNSNRSLPAGYARLSIDLTTRDAAGDGTDPELSTGPQGNNPEAGYVSALDTTADVDVAAEDSHATGRRHAGTGPNSSGPAPVCGVDVPRTASAVFVCRNRSFVGDMLRRTHSCAQQPWLMDAAAAGAVTAAAAASAGGSGGAGGGSSHAAGPPSGLRAGPLRLLAARLRGSTGAPAGSGAGSGAGAVTVVRPSSPSLAARLAGWLPARVLSGTGRSGASSGNVTPRGIASRFAANPFRSSGLAATAVAAAAAAAAAAGSGATTAEVPEQGHTPGAKAAPGLALVPPPPVLLGNLQSYLASPQGDATPQPFPPRQASHARAGNHQPQALLLLRGLRVRMGIHSGVHLEADVAYSSRMTRYIYSGVPMATAKAVAGAAAGGMVVCSSDTHDLLTLEAEPGQPHVVLRAGRGGSGVAGTAGQQVTTGKCVFWYGGVYGLDEHLAPLEIYAAAAPTQVPRWAVLPPPAAGDKADMIAPGVLAAPVGPLAVATITVTGAGSIAAWNEDVWLESASLLWREAARMAAELGGFVATTRSVATSLPLAPGVRPSGIQSGRSVSSKKPREHVLALAVFPTSAAAVQWSSGLLVYGLLAPWPAALLLHDSGEEVWLQEEPAGGPGADGVAAGGSEQDPSHHAPRTHAHDAVSGGVYDNGGGGGADRWSGGATAASAAAVTATAAVAAAIVRANSPELQGPPHPLRSSTLPAIVLGIRSGAVSPTTSPAGPRSSLSGRRWPSILRLRSHSQKASTAGGTSQAGSNTTGGGSQTSARPPSLCGASASEAGWLAAAAPALAPSLPYRTSANGIRRRSLRRILSARGLSLFPSSPRLRPHTGGSGRPDAGGGGGGGTSGSAVGSGGGGCSEHDDIMTTTPRKDAILPSALVFHQGHGHGHGRNQGMGYFHSRRNSHFGGGGVPGAMSLVGLANLGVAGGIEEGGSFVGNTGAMGGGGIASWCSVDRRSYSSRFPRQLHGDQSPMTSPALLALGGMGPGSGLGPLGSGSGSAAPLRRDSHTLLSQTSNNALKGDSGNPSVVHLAHLTMARTGSYRTAGRTGGIMDPGSLASPFVRVSGNGGGPGGPFGGLLGSYTQGGALTLPQAAMESQNSGLGHHSSFGIRRAGLGGPHSNAGPGSMGGGGGDDSYHSGGGRGLHRGQSLGRGPGFRRGLLSDTGSGPVLVPSLPAAGTGGASPATYDPESHVLSGSVHMGMGSAGGHHMNMHLPSSPHMAHAHESRLLDYHTGASLPPGTPGGGGGGGGGAPGGGFVGESGLAGLFTMVSPSVVPEALADELLAADGRMAAIARWKADLIEEQAAAAASSCSSSRVSANGAGNGYGYGNVPGGWKPNGVYESLPAAPSAEALQAAARRRLGGSYSARGSCDGTANTVGGAGEAVYGVSLQYGRSKLGTSGMSANAALNGLAEALSGVGPRSARMSYEHEAVTGGGGGGGEVSYNRHSRVSGGGNSSRHSSGDGSAPPPGPTPAGLATVPPAYDSTGSGTAAQQSSFVGNVAAFARRAVPGPPPASYRPGHPYLPNVGSAAASVRGPAAHVGPSGQWAVSRGAVQSVQQHGRPPQGDAQLPGPAPSGLNPPPGLQLALSHILAGSTETSGAPSPAVASPAAPSPAAASPGNNNTPPRGTKPPLPPPFPPPLPPASLPPSRSINLGHDGALGLPPLPPPSPPLPLPPSRSFILGHGGAPSPSLPSASFAPSRSFSLDQEGTSSLPPLPPPSRSLTLDHDGAPSLPPLPPPSRSLTLDHDGCSPSLPPLPPQSPALLPPPPHATGIEAAALAVASAAATSATTAAATAKAVRDSPASPRSFTAATAPPPLPYPPPLLRLGSADRRSPGRLAAASEAAAIAAGVSPRRMPSRALSMGRPLPAPVGPPAVPHRLSASGTPGHAPCLVPSASAAPMVEDFRRSGTAGGSLPAAPSASAPLPYAQPGSQQPNAQPQPHLMLRPVSVAPRGVADAASLAGSTSAPAASFPFFGDGGRSTTARERRSNCGAGGGAADGGAAVGVWLGEGGGRLDEAEGEGEDPDLESGEVDPRPPPPPSQTMPPSPGPAQEGHPGAHGGREGPAGPDPGPPVNPPPNQPPLQASSLPVPSAVRHSINRQPSNPLHQSPSHPGPHNQQPTSLNTAFANLPFLPYQLPGAAQPPQPYGSQPAALEITRASPQPFHTRISPSGNSVALAAAVVAAAAAASGGPGGGRGDAAGGMARMAGRLALPLELVPVLVCRGLRLRAGVAEGSTALEIDAVSGGARYTSHAVQQSLELAAAAPLGQVLVSAASAASAAATAAAAGASAAAASAAAGLTGVQFDGTGNGTGNGSALNGAQGQQARAQAHQQQAISRTGGLGAALGLSPAVASRVQVQALPRAPRRGGGLSKGGIGNMSFGRHMVRRVSREG
ncbi:hypothetical protein HYH03_014692 [Edaphochlamys debaryana]|uniref:Guanylate cyclase domain-containing protein n=1 Tax=Edaphochlamys debaryana TaxID=47281 RepID=A0A835XQY6_9CHLO|nr:hypothetical protein HYH03_014692 [Edaphochlamys debaryana]|eukprot:KAG2486636.1 hypothetical protein HYH03_014692 [Edaphochlamys debaryana]